MLYLEKFCEMILHRVAILAAKDIGVSTRLMFLASMSYAIGRTIKAVGAAAIPFQVFAPTIAGCS